MNTLVIVLAVAGQWEYGAASRSPVPAPPAAPAPAPPPVIVKFNEDAATKDDVRQLADSIAELRKDVAALKAAPRPTAPPAKAAAPPQRKTWTLADDSGKRWTSDNPDQLIAHVARENQRLAAAPRYVAAPIPVGPACSGGVCGMSLGSFSSGFTGMPLFGGFAGGCAGGGCAGGSCR